MITIYAHRGNMSQFPENTMESFEDAVKIGCPWLELDIRRSKDGVLVVTHDENTLRVTNKNRLVAETNYSELLELNFGDYHNNNQLYLLPTLEQVFYLIKNKTTKVSIQPKENGLIHDVINLAKKCGVYEQIGFNDINCEYLIEAKLEDIKIPVCWDRLKNSNLNTDIAIAKQYKFDTLMYLNEAITREKIIAVKYEGINVGVCVVNDLIRFKEYRNAGATHFYTDYPKEFLENI